VVFQRFMLRSMSARAISQISKPAQALGLAGEPDGVRSRPLAGE
jgi:hypothetical protein